MDCVVEAPTATSLSLLSPLAVSSMPSTNNSEVIKGVQISDIARSELINLRCSQGEIFTFSNPFALDGENFGV